MGYFIVAVMIILILVFGTSNVLNIRKIVLQKRKKKKNQKKSVVDDKNIIDDKSNN